MQGAPGRKTITKTGGATKPHVSSHPEANMHLPGGPWSFAFFTGEGRREHKFIIPCHNTVPPGVSDVGRGEKGGRTPPPPSCSPAGRISGTKASCGPGSPSALPRLPPEKVGQRQVQKEGNFRVTLETGGGGGNIDGFITAVRKNGSHFFIIPSFLSLFLRLCLTSFSTTFLYFSYL